MKYAIAIALMLGSFTFAQANESAVDEDGCAVDPAEEGCGARASVEDADKNWHDDMDRKDREEMYRRRHLRIFSEITDIDPFAETAQGGDRDSDAGGEDFGGDADRAAASTSAE